MIQPLLQTFEALDSDQPMTWDIAGQFCESFAKWVKDRLISSI